MKSNVKHNIKPIQQGQLDGFCGIYLLINAVNYLCGPLHKNELLELAYELTTQLNKKRKIVDVFVDGTTLGQIKYMFQQSVKRQYKIKLIKPEFRVKSPDKAYLLKGMREHTLTGGVVLLGLDSFHDHWTLTHRITEKRVNLLDSSNLKYLNISSITTNENNNHRHLISPSYILFLSKC